jgi:hypothetical protein
LIAARLDGAPLSRLRGTVELDRCNRLAMARRTDVAITEDDDSFIMFLDERRNALGGTALPGIDPVAWTG